MIVCKGDIAYKCTELSIEELRKMVLIHFSIIEPISRDEIVDMFTEDKSFYFYDDVLKGRMLVTNDKKMVGMRIGYNADSTCSITIILTKGDDDDES